MGNCCAKNSKKEKQDSETITTHKDSNVTPGMVEERFPAQHFEAPEKVISSVNSEIDREIEDLKT